MSEKLHHVSITSRNINKSINFYQIFGFKSEKIYDDIDITICWIINNSSRIEILQFKKSQGEEKPIDDNNFLEKFGISHIAIKIDNVESWRERLMTAGISCTRISEARIGSFSYFFIDDPDGNKVEIIGDKT
ncbi:VOC family protein [Yersinia pestis]|nr:VOC family protein [Yersinia pestis]